MGLESISKITFAYALSPEDGFSVDDMSSHLSSLKTDSFATLKICPGSMILFDKQYDSIIVSIKGDCDSVKKIIDTIIDNYDLPHEISRPFKFPSFPKIFRRILGNPLQSPSTTDMFDYFRQKTKEQNVHYTAIPGGKLAVGYHF